MPLDGVDFIDESTAVQLTPSPLYGMISITDPGRTAPLKEGWGCGVLRLQFDDTEEASSFSPYGSSREIPFDREDAKKIIQWLDRCVRQLAYVYVHCFGGISRSAAVAKFIAERYGLPFDHDYTKYNKLVYQILKEEDRKTASVVRYRGALYQLVTAKGAADRLRNPNQLYLRIGKNFGASKFGLDEEWQRETGKRYERGTSVYFVYPHADGYMISAPLQERAMYGVKGDYFDHMFTKVLIKPLCSGEIYLVKGRLFPIRDYETEERQWGDRTEDDPTSYWTYDTGSDGEPLLQPSTIKVVKQVPLEDFLKKFYLNRSYEVGRILEPGWGSGRRTLSEIYDAGEFEAEFCGAEEFEDA